VSDTVQTATQKIGDAIEAGRQPGATLDKLFRMDARSPAACRPGRISPGMDGRAKQVVARLAAFGAVCARGLLLPSDGRRPRIAGSLGSGV
jgi:hypothetical protein